MILYTSDKKIYLGFTCFTLVFGLVYEYFSHGVFSWHMGFLFLFPLAGGVVPYMILGHLKNKKQPDRIAKCLWNSGIAALTMGSCIHGILEIYGTASVYIPVYYIAGGIFIVSGAVRYFVCS